MDLKFGVFPAGLSNVNTAMWVIKMGNFDMISPRCVCGNREVFVDSKTNEQCRYYMSRKILNVIKTRFRVGRHTENCPNKKRVNHAVWLGNEVSTGFRFSARLSTFHFQYEQRRARVTENNESTKNMSTSQR